MVQNTLVIQNQAAQAAREDIEEAIQAVATNNSYVNTGSPPAEQAPPQTYPNMWWHDPYTNLIKIRNEADTGWLDGFYINQVSGAAILDDTYVLKTNGQLGGILGDQTTSTWETGTGTTESLVSPAKVKAAVEAHAPSSALTLGTFTAASGNSYLDFTVPTTATEIYVNYYDVIPTGGVEVQLLVSGSPVTTGYYSSSGTSGAESGKTSAFYMYCINSRNLTGVMSITKASSTVWMETHSSTQNFAENSGAGRLINAGTVNGVRFKAGTSFSGGQVSVSYR